MKLDLVHFLKNQINASLHSEEQSLDVVELSSADLETVVGGLRCPCSGSNGSSSGFPSGGSSFGPPSYNGSSFGNTGYNTNSYPNSGYESGFAQITVYEVTLTPTRCPYSSSSY